MAFSQLRSVFAKINSAKKKFWTISATTNFWKKKLYEPFHKNNQILKQHWNGNTGSFIHIFWLKSFICIEKIWLGNVWQIYCLMYRHWWPVKLSSSNKLILSVTAMLNTSPRNMDYVITVDILLTNGFTLTKSYITLMS